jgi:two-component system alkaline phosphatase synthesis response regulator PhoP
MKIMLDAAKTVKSKKILVVDDDAVVVSGLSTKLKGSGYLVLVATDGSEAVSISRREKPDLILLDITFPPDVGHGGGVPWDGFLIMQWLRRLDEVKNIPIIIIGGNVSVDCKGRSIALGAVGYFHKPINNDELLALIGKTLGENSQEIDTPGT